MLVVEDETTPGKRNSRNIYWVYDWWGNHGKSTIMHYMRLQKKGIVLPAINDQKILVESFADICMAKNLRDPGAVFIDIPRAMSQLEMKGFSAAMESIKGGHVMETRNRFREWDCHSPSVWMFANTKCPHDAFTEDRCIQLMFTSKAKDAILTVYEEGAELPYLAEVCQMSAENNARIKTRLRAFTDTVLSRRNPIA